MENKKSGTRNLCLALTGALLVAASGGCVEGEEEPGEGQASIQIRFHDDGTVDADKSGPSALDKAGEYTDVTRILVDVTYTSTGQPFMVNFPLTSYAPDDWSGELPFLPVNEPLTFAARAYDADDLEIFSGSSDATLTIPSQSIEIPLAPSQDGETYEMPRMYRIVYPTEIVAEQEAQIIFTVEGNAGETITFDLTSNDGSSPFVPAQGAITLTNTVADFVTLYTAPDVATQTDLGHRVTITSDYGTSAVAIATEFATTVLPQSVAVQGVDAEPRVLFNPVVMSLTGNGSLNPGEVTFNAEVSDDSDPASIVYQWSYTPNAGTPNATFANGGTDNPGILQGYTVAHQGEIALAVTDEDGGTTTLHYTLAPDAFADAIDPGQTLGIKKIVAGVAHTCVLTGDDTVRCWGDAQYGQLGYGNAQDIGDDPARLPFTAGEVPLPATDPVMQLVAGHNHTCARLQSGWVYCWGYNDYGQLGYATTEHLGDGEPITSFGYVSLGGPARKIAAGSNHNCAILENGVVRCWGRNNVGQLGYGYTENIGDDENVFEAGNVDLGAGIEVEDLGLGERHTCALLSTGNIRCWGENDNGELGYGNTQHQGDNESLLGLADVALPGPVRKVTAGHSHTCALMENGALRCWGHTGHGELGYGWSTGNYGDQSGETPLALSDIAFGAVVTDVEAGRHHTCALLSDGNLKCWGYNAYGQLGYGHTSERSTPPANGVDLDGFSAYQLAAGLHHTCALRVDGEARCWGAGGQGRLGQGNTSSLYSPAAADNIQIFAP